MLQSKANWRYIETNHQFVDNMTETSTNLSPVIKELLLQRGITTAAEAKTFLNPKTSYLHKPSLLDSCDQAVQRIALAIEEQENILVFGDYDADGVTSTTLLMKTLEELQANCEYYIPNRFTEGYGPNEEAFKWAHATGFTLIITVDSGIASVHEAQVAKELGMDLIITDHHEVQDEIPDAYAVVHPKCSEDYPYEDLAGVGVAFKLSEQLLGYFPEQFLDLVAIGTVADMVPLNGENRILTYYGLQKLTTTTRPGLRALKQQCKIEGNVTEEDIGFLISPRLNAVGRLQEADLAVELLSTEDVEEAEELATAVQQLNTDRQQIVSTIVEEAESMVDVSKQNVIVVAKEGWNEGVLGIVASRLVKKYNRPAIVFTKKRETNTAKGSARSIPAFDMFENLMELKGLLTHFGGHAQAAGMSLSLENMDELKQRLNHQITAQLKPEDYQQTVDINKHLHIPEINEALVEEVNQLAPFGMANPKPIFHIRHPARSIRQLGHLKNHLKLQFKSGQQQLEAIGFGLGDLYPLLSKNIPISMVGELNINEWNGVRKTQMVIKDVKIDEWQIFDHRGQKKIDLQPYLNQYQHHVIVKENNMNITNSVGADVKQITYDLNGQDLEQADVVYLFDLPPNMEALQTLIGALQPKNIHLCFYLQHSTYLTPFPSREDFKWLYIQVLKLKKVDLRESLPMMMKAKGWTKENIIFMFKVFLELEFVKINAGIVELNSAPQKRDLDVSTSYRNRVNQAKIEKQLYYAKLDDLYHLFSNLATVV